jgi:hypothetical protein
VNGQESEAWVTVVRGVVMAGAMGVLVVLLAGCNCATAAPALTPLTTPSRTNSSPAPSTTVNGVPPGAHTLPTGSARVTQNSRPSAALRPMTSGESQYRYGYQQGYIMQGCEQFTDAALRRKGIDPNS